MKELLLRQSASAADPPPALRLGRRLTISNLHTLRDRALCGSPGSGAPSVEASFYGWLSRRAGYKITMDFTGGHQNESMLAYLFRVLLTSFQPPGRSPEEVVRPASHALPTPSWESTQRKIVIAPNHRGLT